MPVSTESTPATVKTVSAVAFDLGGVLLDWDPRHLYRRLFGDPAEMEDFLATVCTTDWHLAHDLGESTRESCLALAGQRPEHAELIMAWADGTEEMIGGVFEDTVEIVRDLKHAGVGCYTVSNMEAETFPVRLARFPFLRWFDGHVISGLERVAKPDPAIFRILLDRHGLEPSAVVFIDDREVNTDAARRLGMGAIWFRSARQLRQALEALGVLDPDR